MNHEILCIFTQLGKTYTFRDVSIVCNNESVISFKYKAMSDGQNKTATFQKSTICGWSVTEQKPQASGSSIKR